MCARARATARCTCRTARCATSRRSGRTLPRTRAWPRASRGRRSTRRSPRAAAPVCACSAACRWPTATTPARSRRASWRSASAELRGDLRQNACIRRGERAMTRLLPMLLLLLCAGCGEMSPHSKADVLNTTLNAYANALRWGDFEQALTFIDPETLKDHPLSELDKERYKQVRVASYTERPPVPAGNGEIQQIVEI